jgi:beta-galactosidase
MIAMRKTVLVAAVIALLLPAASAPQQRAEPFVPVGVWYGGGAVRPPIVARQPARERDAWRQDLRTIRSLGFNSVRNWIDWAAAEPERGKYDFAALDQLLALAGESDLKVIVQTYTDSAPPWLRQRYPDAGVVAAPGSEPKGFCLDHPGVRADVVAFLRAVAERAARHPSFYAIDVWSDPRIANPAWFDTPVDFCYCAHTQARFREWLEFKYGSIPSAPNNVHRRTFVAVKLREDLELKADAAAARGGRPVVSHTDVPAIMHGPRPWPAIPDDWWMSAVVDHYGTSVYPKRAAAPASWPPVHLAATLDAIRSAGRAKGWWVGQLQGGRIGPAAAPVTAADIRLWSWAALSRGARAISYFAWYDSNGFGLVDSDGAVSDRAKAAGEFAGIVGRNPGLFGPLRPRSSRIALLFDPVAFAGGGTATRPGSNVSDSMRAFYREMFERNMPVDIIHADDIFVEDARRYRAIYLPDPKTLAKPIAAALDTYVRGGGTLVSGTRDVERARIAPDIRISGAPGLVDARFLHSGDALLLIAINHSEAPQKVTMSFSPDTPEAIWQNLEAGTSVSFVMGKDGPFLTHAFAPRDVLVLVIRKRLR